MINDWKMKWLNPTLVQWYRLMWDLTEIHILYFYYNNTIGVRKSIRIFILYPISSVTYDLTWALKKRYRYCNTMPAARIILHIPDDTWFCSVMPDIYDNSMTRLWPICRNLASCRVVVVSSRREKEFCCRVLLLAVGTLFHWSHDRFGNMKIYRSGPWWIFDKIARTMEERWWAEIDCEWVCCDALMVIDGKTRRVTTPMTTTTTTTMATMAQHNLWTAQRKIQRDIETLGLYILLVVPCF